MGNVLTRAVGVGDGLVLDTRYETLEPGDLFLLSTDGLTDMVGDLEIADLMTDGPIESTADALLALTLARGATDNVTILIVQPS
jgi:serine/threonine protein phosphatase PrpC